MTAAAGPSRTSGTDPVPLREDEIRPEQLMAGQAARYQADVARLLEGRASFVAVACPACAEHAAQLAFSKHTLQYLRCERCQTLYISPRPTPEQLKTYYATSENYAYWNKYVFPASEAARRAKIFVPRIERLLEICRRQSTELGTLLEVGAGSGIFCEELARRGVFRRVVGVEPTPELAQTCRGRGIEVIESPIEELAAESIPCDVVASFEVIEHLFEPLDFLGACRNRLRPRGVLILTCPNGQGFDVETLGPASDTVDTEHLNYFNPRSMGLLLARAGLEPLEITTPGKLDAELVRKAALDGRVDLAPLPFLRRVLLEEWDRLGASFQQFLAVSGLSSHMWIVARPSSQEPA